MKKMFKGKVRDLMVGSSSLSNYRWYTVVRVSFTDGTIGLWRVVISATNGKVISFEPIKQGPKKASHPTRLRRPSVRR
jgi:hypothetical protein